MELLVVIAIIAVLVALSAGGIFKYRNAADKAAVLGNMRGLQQANAMWASDHSGRYISVFAFDEDGKATTRWFSNTEFLENLSGDSELDNSYKMPESLLDPKVVRAKRNGWQSLSANFGYIYDNMPGGNYGSENTDRGFRVSQVVNPARTAAFISCTDWIAKYSGRYIWDGSAAVEGASPDGKIAFRHDGKAAVVYYDGHVGLISKADFQKIDSNGKQKNAFWNGNAY